MPMYKHSRVILDWVNSSDDLFRNIPNTPDVVLMDTDRKEVLVLEIAVWRKRCFMYP